MIELSYWQERNKEEKEKKIIFEKEKSKVLKKLQQKMRSIMVIQNDKNKENNMIKIGILKNKIQNKLSRTTKTSITNSKNFHENFIDLT